MNIIEVLRSNNSLIWKNVLSTYCVPVMKRSLAVTKIMTFSPRNSQFCAVIKFLIEVSTIVLLGTFIY